MTTFFEIENFGLFRTMLGRMKMTVLSTAVFFVVCTATARRSCQIFPAGGERLGDTLNIYDLLFICLTDIFYSKYGDFCGDFFS